MEKLPITVEEPLEINPPFKLAKLATDKVEEADNGPDTWKVLATVEELWAMNPPATVKANTEVLAAFWISKALPVWPVTVRKAKLVE